jgi:2-polyprenyl-3-methyl-5-hydroxy-6-metoxy-1,4-benzoquinol methylase
VSRVLSCTLVEGIRCYSADVATSYDDYPADGFDVTDETVDTSFWVRSRNRLFKRLVLRELKGRGHARLLEIGCATGDFILHLLDQSKLEITGSEVYLAGLQAARKRLPQVEFVQFDVTQGIIGQSYDIISAFDVLEHIEDDRAAIAHIYDMLSDEGITLISAPQHPFLWGRLDEIVRHKRRYTRAEMVSKLSESGFAVERVTSFVCALFPLMALSRLMDRKERKRMETDAAALERRVCFPPVVNALFDLVMRVDEALIRRGVSLPFGGTLVVVARKR